MRYDRLIAGRLRSLFATFPAVVLTGARQVGKTTLLKQLFPELNYVSLDVPSIAGLAENDPEVFLRNHPPPLIIDEVQYAPNVFRHLKIEIDKAPQQSGQFILTGSQKFTLMGGVSDSLAGRCGICEMETLSCQELKPAHAEKLSYLWRGMFPKLWDNTEIDSEEFYNSYLATYIERDVRQILNISSLRDFERFIRACANRSGQLLNMSSVASEVGVTVPTVKNWLSVLEASNQITLLEPYFGNVSKQLVKSPKLYFNECGLLAFMLGLSRDSVFSSPSIGAIWESFVLAELRKIFSTKPRAKIWFYRDKQREVDFVIDLNGELSLLECKWTGTPVLKDSESLFNVAKTLAAPIGNLQVVCRTPVSMPLDKERRVLAVSGFELAEIYG